MSSRLRERREAEQEPRARAQVSLGRRVAQELTSPALGRAHKDRLASRSTKRSSPSVTLLRLLKPRSCL